MHTPPIEEMRPGQVVHARDASGCAFVPVSPAFEWHSYHLPMGTDALIAEAICREVAGRVGGVWFRPLSLGLDAWRGPDELRAWGFDEGDRVFGMRFPELPLSSEYVEEATLRGAVSARLTAAGGCGFGHVFLVNHHGGRGQFDALDALAAEHSRPGLAVHALRTYAFSTIRDEAMRVGGHAGLSETTWVLAFRPELVDLAEQADGELSVRQTGILHGEPTIPERYNPRHATKRLADALRRSVLDGLEQHVRQVAALG